MSSAATSEGLVTESASRYTLDEAEREIARRECAMQGHSFDVMLRMGHDGPHMVVCSRCGKSWDTSEVVGVS